MSADGAGVPALDLLGRARTVLLTSFRRDGTPVPTPVWVVRRGGELLIWTNPASGKIKRIRRNPAVTLAPSSFGGEPHGAAVPGIARLLGAAELPAVLAAIRSKYGVAGRLTVMSSRLGGWLQRRPQGGLSVTLNGPGAGE